MIQDQLAALNEMLSEILPTNRFYQHKLADTALESVDSIDDFIQNCPFTTKTELVDLLKEMSAA